MAPASGSGMGMLPFTFNMCSTSSRVFDAVGGQNADYGTLGMKSAAGNAFPTAEARRGATWALLQRGGGRF